MGNLDYWPGKYSSPASAYKPVHGGYSAPLKADGNLADKLRQPPDNLELDAAQLQAVLKLQAQEYAESYFAFSALLDAYRMAPEIPILAERLYTAMQEYNVGETKMRSEIEATINQIDILAPQSGMPIDYQTVSPMLRGNVTVGLLASYFKPIRDRLAKLLRV